MWRTIIVSLALICLLLLGWYAVRKFPGRIEADLQAQAQTALASRVPNVVVRASQRDLVLTGSVATDADRTAAETLAKELSGVKTVVNELVVRTDGAAPAPVPTPTPTPTPDTPSPDTADVEAANAANAPDVVTEKPDASNVLEMEALEPDEPAADTTTADAATATDTEAKAPEGPDASPDTAVAPAPSGTLTAAQCREAVQAAIEGEKRVTFVGMTGKFTPEGEAKLDEVWAILKRCPDAKGTIEAYHDDYGDPDKLKTLTQVRAYNTHKRLVDQGMPDKRFRYVGLGYRNMRYGGGAKRVLNQRVEFNITVE